MRYRVRTELIGLGRAAREEVGVREERDVDGHLPPLDVPDGSTY